MRAPRSSPTTSTTSSGSPKPRTRSSTSSPATRRRAPRRGSTRSCCPTSLHFAEYNAESPAGIGYTQRLCELFDATAVMSRFRETRQVRFHRSSTRCSTALMASYQSGAARRRRRRWRSSIGATCRHGRSSKSCATRSSPPASRRSCAIRGSWSFGNGTLSAQGTTHRSRLSSRARQRHPRQARRVRGPRRRVQRRAVCMANSFRCKLAHKKAFFAVLTDPANASMFSAAERDVINAHIPWTRVLDDVRDAEGRLARRAARADSRVARAPRAQAERRVRRQGRQPRVGDDRRRSGTVRSRRRSTIRTARGSCRSGFRCGAKCSPSSTRRGRITMNDMLVDFAPYLFRGSMGGYLTRLSATGLANVTSGGGQVPAFSRRVRTSARSRDSESGVLNSRLLPGPTRTDTPPTRPR